MGGSSPSRSDAPPSRVIAARPTSVRTGGGDHLAVRRVRRPGHRGESLGDVQRLQARRGHPGTGRQRRPGAEPVDWRSRPARPVPAGDTGHGHRLGRHRGRPRRPAHRPARGDPPVVANADCRAATGPTSPPPATCAPATSRTGVPARATATAAGRSSSTTAASRCRSAWCSAATAVARSSGRTSTAGRGERGVPGRYLDPDEVPDPPRRATITQRGASRWRGGCRVRRRDRHHRIRYDDPDGGLGIAGAGGQVRHVDIELVDGPLQVGRRYAVKVTATNAVGTSAPRVRYVTIQPYPIP